MLKPYPLSEWEDAPLPPSELVESLATTRIVTSASGDKLPPPENYRVGDMVIWEGVGMYVCAGDKWEELFSTGEKPEVTANLEGLL